MKIVVKKEGLLLDYLVNNLDMSRKTIKQYLQKGSIYVDGVRTTKFDYPLSINSIIKIDENSKNRSELPFEVLYEDKDIIVVDKPSGILSIATEKEKVMALNENKNLKLYFSIKEVATMMGVSESLLRFWEKEIPLLKPKTTGNNIRQYTESDIENVKVVYNLVKVRGFKLQAARKMLRENRQGVNKNARIMEGLVRVREELQLLKKQMDYLT